MNASEAINLTANCSSIFIIALLLVAVAFGRNLDELVFRRFFYLLLLALFGWVCDFLVWFLTGRPGPVVYFFMRFFDYFSYSVAGFQFIAWGLYLKSYLSTKAQVPNSATYMIISSGFIIILMTTWAQFNGMFTRIDENNNYHQGELAWISQSFSAVALFITAIIILRHSKAFDPRERVPLLLYPASPIICYIIELAYPGVWIAQAGYAFTLFMIYINNQTELRIKIKAQETELTDSRISIMLSQIQPHFLYNTLTAIDALCYENTKAHEAIVTFSEYLRINMNSLSQKTLIPFEKELEHVRQYLWLEELRFGERLKVEYDIQVNEFLLPVLTLQPLVENAIRHGITKKGDGGTVVIRTQETPSSIQLLIIDNGTGFNPNIMPQDGQTHIGIENVRIRLANMCRGQVMIESAPGKGTTAMIEIPKEVK